MLFCNLLGRNYAYNTSMDKLEIRRLALRRLTDGLGRGGIKLVGEQIEKDASTISRMLSEPGSYGHRPIYEETADLITSRFPSWLDDDASDGDDTDQSLEEQFKALLLAIPPGASIEVLRSIVDKIQPGDAFELAQLFLARAAEGGQWKLKRR
jgi:hypothetical protein